MLALPPLTSPLPGALQPPALVATVTVRLDRPLARFVPREAIGAALDGHGEGEIAQIYTPANERAMASAGLGAVSYRLRTELGAQAWHVQVAGSWSEPSRAQGYWTTSTKVSGTTGASGHTAIGPRATRHASQPASEVSWGYWLPRRGNTIDQANDNGYSRLDDGNAGTLWKSNPYLDSHYTHEPESRHAQWVMIDLGRRRAVDALRIKWATPYPYATRFSVQTIAGADAVVSEHAEGTWRDFPHGVFAGHPGIQTLRLARTPMRVRWVRVLLSSSSHTGPPGSHDVRDRLGYAIDEVQVGTRDARGRLQDEIRHEPNASQTVIWTSSTDPWHSAADRNPDYEQPSFQTVLRSGLTRGRRLLVPVPLLYGTPENAVAEVRYLRALGVPLRGVELGEEPDGQLASPEDYGALYVQFARAIHRAFPHLALGGPGYQTAEPDWVYWPNARGERSWTRRFLDYLRAHGAMRLLSFFSFEWYPYDDVCAPPGPQLAEASQRLRDVLVRQHGDGLPAGLPVYVTEYGYSPFAGQDEVDMPGALLDADVLGTALSDGVRATYMYGYEPEGLLSEGEGCRTWGNLALWESDEEHHALHPLAPYWETRMLTGDWTEPAGTHTLYATSSTATDAAGHELVRAYAVRRPDGRVAVLLLNMSPSQPYDVSLSFASGTSAAPPVGPLSEWQLSNAQYRWQADGPHGHPSLDQPPARSTLASGGQAVRLAPYSITVLRTLPSV